ncbi:MAG: DinB family protein, partial [Planctomycetota bacterium]
GSIWATLVHLYGAEHAWIETLEGRVDAPVPGPDVFANLGQLADAWPGVHRRWWAFLDTVNIEELTRPVARRSVSTAGRTRQMPLHDVLIHVCTHAQYTGAQMTNMLRQSGVSDLGSAAISMTVLSRAEHGE